MFFRALAVLLWFALVVPGLCAESPTQFVQRVYQKYAKRSDSDLEQVERLKPILSQEIYQLGKPFTFKSGHYLDFDILTGVASPTIGELKVLKSEVRKGMARVKISLLTQGPRGDSRQTLTLDLKQEEGWKIDDVTYSGPQTLRQILKDLEARKHAGGQGGETEE